MIAIHNRPGSFSDKWIAYCDHYRIPYKLVDCYASNILEQLTDCTGLMWHWNQSDYKASLFVRQLTYSLESIGKRVFPSLSTAWHFDDKVGQKYLLESIGVPMVPTFVFYSETEALSWATTTTYPKVFKLRGGAGSENVRIANKRSDAERLIKTAFRRGFKVKNRLNFLKERIWHVKRDRTLKSLLNITKGLARLLIPKEAETKFPLEKNYVYFQNFIPNNNCDIRVIVIGKRAFGIKRMVRKGDFRASGSGQIIYEPNEIPIRCLEFAFEISKKVKTQSVACDFVFDGQEPLVVEISYAFSSEGYTPCPGYWTDQLQWVEGSFSPEVFMIEDFIKECFLDRSD